MKPAAEVTVRATPDAGTWADLARQRFAQTPIERRRERAELGLPTDRPVIMTGHQAGFWHPGILSKYIAADSVAKAVDGVAAAIVVDHDTVDPLKINAVLRKADGGVRQTTVTLHQRAGEATLPRLQPVVDHSELKPIRLPDGLLPPDDAALHSIKAKLARFTESESLGEQAALANAEMLQRWTRAKLITAARLVDTESWRRFFFNAMEDHQNCVQAYNRAVAAHPNAGIPPLFAIAREHRWELPFWLLDATQGRRRFFAEMADQNDFEMTRVATKALSLTASLRLGLCDLFIHGAGGAIYDRATDDWISQWLGEKLAPSVAISADLHRSLEVDCDRDVTEQERDHAIWLAHAAWHNPGLLGDEAAATQKRRLLKQIDALPRQSTNRLDRYRQMHTMLASIRKEHASEFRAIRERTRESELALAVLRLEARRDWPSVFYQPGQLDRLADAVGKLVSSPKSF